MKLFIDDERKTPSEYTHSANTVDTAINQLRWAKDNKVDLELVSFDYDAHSYLNWTFEAVAVWIRDNDYWPAEIRIHTANSWTGRPWYEKFFQLYAPKTVVIDEGDPNDFNTLISRKAPQWVYDFVEAQR